MDNNSIIVSVSELRSRMQDIRRSGMDFVQLTIFPADDELPKSLEFTASRRPDASEWIDFEEIDAVNDEADLIKKSATAIHMSDNLL